jgi:hypothetical protein
LLPTSSPDLLAAPNPFPAFENEISQFAFEKFQVANYRRRGPFAFLRRILLQRNALHSFSAGKSGWHGSCNESSWLRPTAVNKQNIIL